MAALDFFMELDAIWAKEGTPRLLLKVIGAGALELIADFRRGTKDSDVIQTEEIGTHSKRLLEIAGPGSDLAIRHGTHLELVAPGMPFLPQGPRYEIPKGLENLESLEVRALHPVDVAVSKLKPYRAQDAADIAMLAQSGLLIHADFLTRFKSAIELAALGARREELPRILERFNLVEQDHLGVNPTPVELPDVD